MDITHACIDVISKCDILPINIINTYGVMILLFVILFMSKNKQYIKILITILIVILLITIIKNTYFVGIPSNPSWQNYCGIVFAGGELAYVNLKPIHITSQISINGPIIAKISEFSKTSGQTCIIPCADGDPTWNTSSTETPDRLQQNDMIKQYEQTFGKSFLVFTSCVYKSPKTNESTDPRIRLMPWSDKLFSDNRYMQENHKPYLERKDGLVWRGERNGLIRESVINYLKTKSWADVEFVSPLGRYVDVPEKMSQKDQAEYKLIFSIDGWSYPTSVIWALASGSVMVMMSAWKTVLQLELEPWKHYVPVSMDMHDIDQNVQIVLNDTELGERIAHNAKLKFEQFTPSKFTEILEYEMYK